MFFIFIQNVGEEDFGYRQAGRVAFFPKLLATDRFFNAPLLGLVLCAWGHGRLSGHGMRGR